MKYPLSLIITFLISFSSYSQDQTTIAIHTEGKNVEIFIDGKSFGFHGNDSFAVSPGKHHLEGRRTHYFSDWEKIVAKKDTLISATLEPRFFHFAISGQIQPLHFYNNEITPMVSIDPGIRFWPMYLGLHISHNLSGKGSLLNIGAHVDYLYDYRNIFELCIGIFGTYYQFDKDQEYTNPLDPNSLLIPAVHNNGGSFCPEIQALIGREHFFITAGFTGIFYSSFSPIFTIGFVISP